MQVESLWIHALIEQADVWNGKLDRQEEGVKYLGRKISGSDAKERFFHAVSEAHLSRIIKVDMKSDLFSYSIDESAKTLAELMDGKLLLVTNTPRIADCRLSGRSRTFSEFSTTVFG